MLHFWNANTRTSTCLSYGKISSSQCKSLAWVKCWRTELHALSADRTPLHVTKHLEWKAADKWPPMLKIEAQKHCDLKWAVMAWAKAGHVEYYLPLLPAAVAAGCSVQAQLFPNKACLRRFEPKQSSDMGSERSEQWCCWNSGAFMSSFYSILNELSFNLSLYDCLSFSRSMN